MIYFRANLDAVNLFFVFFQPNIISKGGLGPMSELVKVGIGFVVGSIEGYC